jgi:serine/threonine protein phosphatase PrpC
MIAEEVKRISLADEDQLLLCTEGLTDMVDTTTIGAVLRSAACEKGVCRTLLGLAL